MPLVFPRLAVLFVVDEDEAKRIHFLNLRFRAIFPTAFPIGDRDEIPPLVRNRQHEK